MERFNDRYRQLIENSSDIIYTLTPEGVIIFVSPAWTRLLGHKAEEVEGHSFTEFVHPDDLTSYYATLQKVLESGKRQEGVEYRMRHKNDKWFWYTTSTSPVKDAAGKVTGFDGIAHDITERRRAEEERNKTLSLLEATLQSMEEGILVVDLKGKVVRYNRSFFDLWQIPFELEYSSDEDFLQYVISQLVDPEGFLSKVRQLYDTPEESSFDEVVFSDGRVFERYSQPQRQDGQVVGRVWCFRDVTKSKQAEEELRESNKRYDQLAKLSRTITWETDAYGLYTHVGPVAKELIGYCPEELIGRMHFYDLHPEEGREAFTTAVLGVFQRRETFVDLDNTLVHKDGHIVWVSTNASPMLNPDGTLSGYRGSDIDIIDRKRLEIENQVLASVIKYSQDFISVAGMGQDVFFINPAGQAMVGLDGEETVKRTKINEYFLEEDLPFFEKTILPALFDQGRWSGEFRFRHFKTGAPIPILYDLFLTENPETGQPTNITTISRDITEQKRAEKALHESEERLDMAMSVKNEGVWDWKLASNEAVFDDRYYTMAGYVPGEFPQNIQAWADHVHPDDLSHCEAVITAYLFGQLESYDVEFRFKHKDDSWIWIMGKGKIVEWDENGLPLRMIGTHTDITDRKKAEEELLKLAAIVQNSSELINLASLDGKMLFINDAGSRMLGISPKNVEQHNIMDVIPKHMQTLVQGELLIDLFEKGRWEGDLQYRNLLTNVLTDVYALCFAIRDEKTGVPLFMANVSRDITERKQAEEALRESEAKLNALFTSLTEMVVLHDLVFDEQGKPVNYRITDCNDAYTRITGITREDAVGLLATEVYGTEEPPYLRELSEVALTGKSYHYETYFPPMGRHFAVNVVSPEKNRFATVTTDITERKHSEEIIEEGRKQLEAKNKELEQLVYVASHDLRSPLVNVDGFSRELEYSLAKVGNLLTSGSLDREQLEKTLVEEFPDMEKALEHIKASSRQMDLLLKGLLKISRLGRAALQIEPVDMNKLLRQLSSTFFYRIEEGGIELIIEEVPPCRGDFQQLTQLFANLLDNAVKYLDLERPGIIKVTGAIKANRSLYYIEDNGIGIAENHQKNIFELFHRLNPSESEGEGLGLTIVKQVLIRLGGEISLVSKPGVGSKFTVTLPWDERKK